MTQKSNPIDDMLNRLREGARPIDVTSQELTDLVSSAIFKFLSEKVDKAGVAETGVGALKVDAYVEGTLGGVVIELARLTSEMPYEARLGVAMYFQVVAAQTIGFILEDHSGPSQPR